MNDKEVLLKKVLELIEKYDLTAYEIGVNTELAITGVQKIIDGQTKKPQKNTLKSIYDYIINKYEYIKSDENEMINENSGSSDFSNAKILNEDEDFVWLETIKIPEKAALGAASNFFAESYMSELERGRVRVKKNHKGNYYEVEATGDSMNDSTAKALLDKDWYLARDIPRDFWKSRLHLSHWNVFYFLHNEKGNLIKEVIDHNPETGDVVLHSWNPDKKLYPDFTINLKDCYIVGNVVKLISRDFNIFY